MKNRVKKNIKFKKNSVKIKKENRKQKTIVLVYYTFLASFILSVIFGIQTNINFFIPFVIVLLITIVCMGIILVNVIYRMIQKNIMRKEKINRKKKGKVDNDTDKKCK